jgi:hypothetical protein
MTVFFLIADVFLCEESTQVGASHPYNIDRNETTRVREGIEHTQALELQQHNAHKSRNKHTNTAQRLHSSTSAQISNTMNRMRACGV